MTQGTFLTNDELIAQLSLRDDLTDLEHDLLDRLIRATDEIQRLEQYHSVYVQGVASAQPASA